jgi:hypothetical protein
MILLMALRGALYLTIMLADPAEACLTLSSPGDAD